MDYEYDPDFRWLVVDGSHGALCRFRDKDDADFYAERGHNLYVKDTKPKSRIPASAQYLLWGDDTEAWFASFVEIDENGDRIWSVANKHGDIYDDESLLADLIREESFIVLKRA